MAQILIIGDVHGKIERYHDLLHRNADVPYSLQVGDFGFRREHEWHELRIDPERHKINFGNHDDTASLGSPHSTGNYGDWNGIFTVRGALSIDRAFRTEGIDWWANEQLTYAEMQQAIDEYVRQKPRIVVSHDCPATVRRTLFGIDDPTLTTSGLQAMLTAHEPDVWLFGHHHLSVRETFGRTQFICLDELETAIITTPSSPQT